MGLFSSCVKCCTFSCTYCLPSSSLRMICMAVANSLSSSLLEVGAVALSPLETLVAYSRKALILRVKRQVNTAPMIRESTSNSAPQRIILFCARSINGNKVRLAFATVRLPIILLPSLMGAAIYITVSPFSSPATFVLLADAGLERTPYLPRSVRYTSFQRE